MRHHSEVEDSDDLETPFHCITCSDEALPATVLSIDAQTNLALVSIEAGSAVTPPATLEVDITLVDSAAPGDILLVHGGVALSHVQSR